MLRAVITMCVSNSLVFRTSTSAAGLKLLTAAADLHCKQHTTSHHHRCCQFSRGCWSVYVVGRYDSHLNSVSVVHHVDQLGVPGAYKKIIIIIVIIIIIITTITTTITVPITTTITMITIIIMFRTLF